MSSGIKPLGPFATWDDCIDAQLARGYGVDESRLICGAIEADSSALVAAPGAEAEIVAALDTFVAELRHGRKRRQPTAADQQYVRMLDRIRRRLEPAFAAELRGAFTKLGPIVLRAYNAAKERKDDDEVTLALVRRVVDAVDFDAFRDTVLKRPYERVYVQTAELVFGAVSQRIGAEIGFSLEDRVGRAIIEAGGKRVGLVDLDGDTRSALFRALHQTRVEGLGPDDTAKLITQYVPAGRFAGQGVEAGSLYRSTMIARTETRFAQGISAIEAGKAAGLQRFVVFDARIGDTDEDCEALDGKVVDAEEAEELMSEEHPNGTRSISPLPSDAVEDAPEPRAPRPAPAPQLAPVTAPTVPLPAVAPARLTPQTIDAPDAPLSPAAEKAVRQYEAAHRGDAVESAGVFSRTGAPLLDKSDGAVRSVNFTTPEVAIMKDAVLTHNHPSGNALSLPDYHMLRSASLYEVRAARNVNRGADRDYGGGTIAARLTDKSRAMTPFDFRIELEAIDGEIRAEWTKQIGLTRTLEQANNLHFDELADRAHARGLLIIRREQ